MEPQPFSHGYDGACVIVIEDHVPSMEPQPFSHGYSSWKRNLSKVLRPLQWSHSLSAMDTGVGPWKAYTRLTFNGATAFQPWIRGEQAAVMRSQVGLQWSHSLSAMDTPPSVHAISYRLRPSMEPQPFSHGYGDGYRQIGQRQTPSMEPQPFSHGYIVELVHIAPGPRSLQWSHSLSAMDTRAEPPGRFSTDRPFNGATAFQPWIRCPRKCWSNSTSRLQWSHSLSAMDTCCPRRRHQHAGALQWSHSLSAMDTRGFQYDGQRYGPFNGATAFQPWIQREIRVTVIIPYRSRLRFQGTTFLPSYACRCLFHNSTMFTAKCARAIPSMRVAPDPSHYERNQASLHTLPQSIQTTKASLCLGLV